MFRRAVVVFEGSCTADMLFYHGIDMCDLGIKSDAIFNYWPPVNLLALIVLVPIRFILTPRRFHSLNVFCTRGSNFRMPFLLLMTLMRPHQEFLLHLS
jgi:hypothetical protein